MSCSVCIRWEDCCAWGGLINLMFGLMLWLKLLLKLCGLSLLMLLCEFRAISNSTGLQCEFAILQTGGGKGAADWCFWSYQTDLEMQMRDWYYYTSIPLPGMNCPTVTYKCPAWKETDISVLIVADVPTATSSTQYCCISGCLVLFYHCWCFCKQPYFAVVCNIQVFRGCSAF